MKRFFAWAFRICCFAVIGAAVFTVARCMVHVNDEHSYDTIMGGAQPQTTTWSQPESTLSPEALALQMSSGAEEDPTVLLRADGGATVNHSTVTVTASFSNIENSILADLSWYVDGELVKEQKDCLLVEGSTMTYGAKIDVEEQEGNEASVELYVDYAGKRTVADTVFPVEKPGENNNVVIRTEEITVTCTEDCGIFYDSDLSQDTGETLSEGDTGLMLEYVTNSTGVYSMRLQFEDGSDGWVSARRSKVTEENCTTDEDYTDEQKIDFVNSMNYDSNTSYLVWVSLYTQKVNIFTGYKGSWELKECFDCASGVNETPTSTGVFTIEAQKERWDLGRTYVEPVLVFHGGEAFTSQPYDSDTDEIANDTIGEPASGGSVWLQEKDIQWMTEHVPLNTMVVVY